MPLVWLVSPTVIIIEPWLVITIPIFSRSHLLHFLSFSTGSFTPSIGQILGRRCHFFVSGTFFLWIDSGGHLHALSRFYGLSNWTIYLDSWANRQNGSFLNNLSRGLTSPFTFSSILILCWVYFVESWSSGRVVERSPEMFFLGLLPLVFLLVTLFLLVVQKLPKFWESVQTKALPVVSIILLGLLVLGVLPFSNIGPFSGTWFKITGKLQSYSVVGKTGATMAAEAEALKFLDVKTTIREASQIPQEVVRNRIPCRHSDLFLPKMYA